MEQTDVDLALVDRLISSSLGLPISWENKDFDSSVKPYLAVQMVPSGGQYRNLKGTKKTLTGFMVVSVVSGLGVYATASSRIADSIAGLFPASLRLSAAGGFISFERPPVHQQSYPDSVSWRTPVKVFYTAQQ